MYAFPDASKATAFPQSLAVPPRNVEYRSSAPVGLSFETKASFRAPPPLNVVSNAPGVVGKSEEFVHPVMTGSPEASRAMPCPRSLLLPPRYVDQTRALPDGFSTATNAWVHVKAPQEPPWNVVEKAPDVTGKSDEFVYPTTDAAPEAFTATPRTRSAYVPPRKEAYTRWLPSALSSTRNPCSHRVSPQVVFVNVVWKAPAVTWKLGEFVRPATNASPDESRATA